MKKVAPYSTLNEAMKSLDNGGRFYNVLTKADDGLITKAELAKVGGLFNDKQKMMLFLEMSLSQLDQDARSEVMASMEPSLQEAYSKYLPKWLTASEANAIEHVAAGLVVSGVPQLKESKTEFTGFIMIPIVAGSVTTFSMIPIMDEYDVYELRDESSSESFLIAHARGMEKLPEKQLQVAGILKELQTEEDTESPTKVFLEAIYHIEV